MPVSLPAASQPSPSADPVLAGFDPTMLAPIHLPQAIPFWPIATGWWLLLATVILAIILVMLLKNRNKRFQPVARLDVSQLAQRELQLISLNYQRTHDALETLKQLSIFLRRYVLSLTERINVAALTDQQWLDYLDNLYHQHFPAEHLFSERYAGLLLEGPYRKSLDKESAALVEQLIAELQHMISGNGSPTAGTGNSSAQTTLPAPEAREGKTESAPHEPDRPGIAAAGVKHV